MEHDKPSSMSNSNTVSEGVDEEDNEMTLFVNTLDNNNFSSVVFVDSEGSTTEPRLRSRTTPSRPVSLSAAHRRWLLGVVCITLGISVLVVVLLQTVAKRKHPFVDPFHPNALCDIEESSRLMRILGIAESTALPPNFANSMMELHVAVLDNDAMKDGGNTFTAVVSLCAGTDYIPNDIKNANHCLIKQQQTMANGTTVTREVPVKYLFAVWNQDGECIDYFDRFVTPTTPFSLVDVSREGSIDHTTGTTHQLEFRATFVMDAQAMVTPRNSSGRLSDTQPLLDISITSQNPASSPPSPSATQQQPRVFMHSYSNRKYSIEVPIAELSPEECRLHGAEWKRTIAEEKALEVDDSKQWDPPLSRSKRRKWSRSTLTSSSKGPVGDDPMDNGKKYNIFGRKVRNLLTDVVVPLLILFVLPSLCILSVLLYRRNKKLSTTIRRHKKDSEDS